MRPSPASPVLPESTATNASMGVAASTGVVAASTGGGPESGALPRTQYRVFTHMLPATHGSDSQGPVTIGCGPLQKQSNEPTQSDRSSQRSPAAQSESSMQWTGSHPTPPWHVNPREPAMQSVGGGSTTSARAAEHRPSTSSSASHPTLIARVCAAPWRRSIGSRRTRGRARRPRGGPAGLGVRGRGAAARRRRPAPRVSSAPRAAIAADQSGRVPPQRPK